MRINWPVLLAISFGVVMAAAANILWIVMVVPQFHLDPVSRFLSWVAGAAIIGGVVGMLIGIWTSPRSE